jgi:hypothetical protein
MLENELLALYFIEQTGTVCCKKRSVYGTNRNSLWEKKNTL